MSTPQLNSASVSDYTSSRASSATLLSQSPPLLGANGLE